MGDQVNLTGTNGNFDMVYANGDLVGGTASNGGSTGIYLGVNAAANITGGNDAITGRYSAERGWRRCLCDLSLMMHKRGRAICAVLIGCLLIDGNLSRYAHGQTNEPFSQDRKTVEQDLGGATKHLLPATRIVTQLVANVAFPAPHGLAWAPDGSALAAYLDFGGNVLRVWRPDGGLIRELRRNTAGGYEGSTLTFANGAASLITPPRTAASEHSAFSIFDIATGELTREVTGPQPDKQLRLNAADVLLASPDQSVLAVIYASMQHQPVALYSMKDWARIGELDESAADFHALPNALAFSNDGKMLAVSRVDGQVFIYDVASRHVLHRIDAFGDVGNTSADPLAFSPDGKFIAVGAGASHSVPLGPDGKTFTLGGKLTLVVVPDPVRVFRIDTGELTGSVAGLPQPIRSMNWSPTGDLLAFAANDSRVEFCDPHARHIQARIVHPEVRGSELKFAPSGKLLAIAERYRVTLIDISFAAMSNKVDQ